MNLLLIILFAALCVGLFYWGWREPEGTYQFPFLAGATFFAFVLPQVIGLRHDTDLPTGALAKTLFMTFLCALMCYAGYRWRNHPMRSFAWSFEQKRLLWVSGVLTGIGAWCFFQISRLPEEMTSASQWSGLTVAYLFFAQILAYGFAVAVILYFRTGSRIALALAIFGSLFYLDRIFIAGRRGIAAEFAFILLLGVAFGRRKFVSRGAMVGVLITATLFLHSTGDYRSITMDEDGPQWSRVSQIPFLDNFRDLLREGGGEMRNVVYMIEATERLGNFDYGAFHWNTLVFNYVPAQILGDEFKQSLLIPLENNAASVFGYEASVGSTVTGMVDAFQSFWYFGCLKFFVLGFLLHRIYAAAAEGHFVAQLFYMLMLMPGLHCITHHTSWFISPWVHIGLFLIPGLVLARTPNQKLTRRNAFSPLLVQQAAGVPS